MSIECLACPALGPSAPFPAYRLAGVASCPGFTGALFRRTPRRARRPRSGVSLGRLRVLPGLPQELGFRRAPLAHDGRVRLLQRIAWLASRLVRTFVRGTGCVRAASRCGRRGSCFCCCSVSCGAKCSAGSVAGAARPDVVCVAASGTCECANVCERGWRGGVLAIHVCCGPGCEVASSLYTG